jgi:hypothetical protein
MIMDNYGMLYFGLLRNHAICKWDSYRPFTLENQQVVAKDDTHIQWTDGELFLRKICKRFKGRFGWEMVEN